MTDTAIDRWFELAVPNPTEKNRNVQFGVHVEEFAEAFEALGETRIAERLQAIASQYKTGSADLHAKEVDKELLLDSLCDQIVTAIGVGYMMGFNIVGALAEVNRSNYSKFVDGKPLFDENGKIKKGPNYTKPNLKPFLTRA